MKIQTIRVLQQKRAWIVVNDWNEPSCFPKFFGCLAFQVKFKMMQEKNVIISRFLPLPLSQRWLSKDGTIAEDQMCRRFFHSEMFFSLPYFDQVWLEEGPAFSVFLVLREITFWANYSSFEETSWVWQLLPIHVLHANHWFVVINSEKCPPPKILIAARSQDQRRQRSEAFIQLEKFSKLKNCFWIRSLRSAANFFPVWKFSGRIVYDVFLASVPLWWA